MAGSCRVGRTGTHARPLGQAADAPARVHAARGGLPATCRGHAAELPTASPLPPRRRLARLAERGRRCRQPRAARSRPRRRPRPARPRGAAPRGEAVSSTFGTMLAQRSAPGGHARPREQRREGCRSTRAEGTRSRKCANGKAQGHRRQAKPQGIRRARAARTVVCHRVAGNSVTPSVSLLPKRCRRGTRRRARTATRSCRRATCRGTASSTGTSGGFCARAAEAAGEVSAAMRSRQRRRAGFEKKLRRRHVGARALARAVPYREDVGQGSLGRRDGHVWRVNRGRHRP